MAVGTLLGYVVAGVLRLKANVRGFLMVFISIIFPLGFVGLGLARTTTAAMLLMVLGGLASGYVTVNVTSLIQITTPSEIRGRVVGLLAALSTALTPIGSGIAGVAAELVDKNVALVFIVCGVVTALIALLLSTNRNYRAIMSTEFEQPRPQRPPREPRPGLPAR
jgi:MFS family permease